MDYLDRDAVLDLIANLNLEDFNGWDYEDINPTQTEAVREAILLAVEWMDTADGQPEPQWIMCSERLPQQGQEVICKCRANMIEVLKLDACGDWYQDAEHCYMSGFVIAWMPLPEPHEGSE